MDYLSGINQFTQVAAQLSVLLLIVRVAFGALNCFMGYRMLKFWISVCGFFLGTGIGMTAVYILQLSGNVKWILPLAAGGITAVLGYEVYLVGAFFLGWVLTTYGTQNGNIAFGSRNTFGCPCGDPGSKICPPMYYLVDGCQWRYEHSNRCLRDPAERFRDSDAAYYGCLCPGGSTFSVYDHT